MRMRYHLRCVNPLRGHRSQRAEAPDPRRAKETVKEMSDAQVVDLLTQLGSKTASWRAPAENRAFLTELLGAMPHQTIPTEEE